MTRSETEERDKDLDKALILSSLIFSALFVLLLWAIHFYKWTSHADLGRFGVLPREIRGLAGILTAPLIHSDLEHLISNSFSLLILLFGLFYFYRESSASVFLLVYVLSGMIVWIFGRQSYHIGASGLVYGFAAFIFFSGLFRRDKSSMALSLIVVFLYGGMIWGVFPVSPEISFESHLSGAIVGTVSAFAFRKYDPPETYEWEEDEDEDGLDYGDKPEEIDETDRLFNTEDDDDNTRRS